MYYEPGSFLPQEHVCDEWSVLKYTYLIILHHLDLEWQGRVITFLQYSVKYEGFYEYQNV